MSELSQLYQEVIIDHNKSPKNFKELDNPTHKAEGYNPLCGDHYTLYLQVEGDKIVDIGFQGTGCAISKSSASLMTACLKGSTLAEAEELFDAFHSMVAEDADIDADSLPEKGYKLVALQGVKKFPTRIKCATLAWHTVKAALDGKQDVSTE
ncbi:MAG: SUF system NifU family Fe-S cluster assembly protein [bacterium]|nr:SUF system NifU family Fe-S cluster assembly protein [bacterium]